MERTDNVEKIRFPLRITKGFSKKIAEIALQTDAKSKHDYIINAILEKIERDETEKQ